jgi:hypothetical protein
MKAIAQVLIENPVIPAQAGIQECHPATKALDSGLRRNDEQWTC